MSVTVERRERETTYSTQSYDSPRGFSVNLLTKASIIYSGECVGSRPCENRSCDDTVGSPSTGISRIVVLSR